MTSRQAVAAPHGPTARESDLSAVYGEGIAAGLIGAAAIALWFLIVDTIAGRPLYTPNLLGTALFRGGQGLDDPASLPISFEMVMVFTWVHALVFAAIGGIAARLLAFAEHTANVGFGIVLLFVIFEFGFIAVSTTLAEQVLSSLAWPAVLVGNMLAATAMGAYFWRRHPNLQIEP
jgi:hypothetical protein